MDHFAGLDVSVKDTSVCIVDDTGKIVREVKVASEPTALFGSLVVAQLRLAAESDAGGRRQERRRRFLLPVALLQRVPTAPTIFGEDLVSPTPASRLLCA